MGLEVHKYVSDTNFENYQVIKKDTLNFLDINANSNKFYTIELHENNGSYRIFTEYGRLGSSTKKEIRYPTSKFDAEKEYEKIIKSKTKKGYVLIELAQSSTGSQKAKELIDTTEIKPVAIIKNKSHLDQPIQKLIKQIYDEAGNKLSHLAKGDSCSDTFPLGKLSISQIDKGRNILQEIANTKTDLINLCNEYYRYIPKAFGRHVTKEKLLIDTPEKINEELEILKFYEDSLRMGDIIYNNEIDKQYESLNCNINLLDPLSSKYIEIVNYVTKSQSRHHGVNLVVKNIYTVSQKKAPEFNASPGNIKELFHGTRSANMIGILSTHLKLPTQLKGVYITGAMFGAGLYFADQSTKSSQYSCSRFGGTTNKYNTSFMLLVDVALGKIKEEYTSKYYHSTPTGYHSVKGVAGQSLLHNEYIIYNENQQLVKYIIEFETSNRR